MKAVILIIILIFAGQILGSLIGVIFKPSRKILHSSLAFAASIMISISLFQLIPQSHELISAIPLLLFFFIGFIFIFFIDKLIPHINPELSKKEKPSVKKSIFMLVIGMAIHNIPEGLAEGSGLALSSTFGIGIALALAIHDIPENIATIIPLYNLNKSRIKSFLITTVTILFELFGFLVAYYLLEVSHKFIGIFLAFAAGVMIYISSEELLPNSNFKRYFKADITALILGFLIFILIVISTMLFF